MGKVHRGGYVFFTWKGDHSPKHVHVYHGNRFVVKWDLENWKAMKGEASRIVLDLIRELLAEGML
jgi:hypothetical protein